MMSISCGAATASGLLAPSGFAWAASKSAAPAPHFAPRARHVVFCFMQGGMSHVDLFDPKPALARYDGQPGDNKNAQSQSGGNRKWLKSPWRFHRHGEAGVDVSELLPRLAGCADDLTVIRSMRAGLPLHSVGNLYLHSGRNRAGFPSLGSWVNYGLGSGDADLPGHILLHFDEVLPGGMESFSNGFLPAQHQATPIRAAGAPIDNLASPDLPSVQRAKLRFLADRDQALSRELGGHAEIDAALRNYDLAHRMQSRLPQVLDLTAEPANMHRLYGLDRRDVKQQQYAAHCLRARRLIEAGVRFVEIVTPPGFSTNGSWDQHSQLKEGHGANSSIVDQPLAALIKDLKARGLLERTIIIICGEMGRTPHSGGRDGRDHHTSCFSAVVAGGGFKSGFVYGATDEFGMEIVEHPVSIHDLHATTLALLGIDHERLTYRFGGRDITLPDVDGRVIADLLDG
jgi:hypothetical protein